MSTCQSVPQPQPCFLHIGICSTPVRPSCRVRRRPTNFRRHLERCWGFVWVRGRGHRGRGVLRGNVGGAPGKGRPQSGPRRGEGAPAPAGKGLGRWQPPPLSPVGRKLALRFSPFFPKAPHPFPFPLLLPIWFLTKKCCREFPEGPDVRSRLRSRAGSGKRPGRGGQPGAGGPEGHWPGQNRESPSPRARAPVPGMWQRVGRSWPCRLAPGALSSDRDTG